MKNLIIPCGGKSSRFPNMKPKWMLTHPDGHLMIEKALSGLNYKDFDRIVITIIKNHDEKYEAKIILEQALKDYGVEICVLPEFTASASQTVYETIKQMSIIGGVVVKDSDNYVKADVPMPLRNCIVGYDLVEHPNVSNIPAKSFIVYNEQGIIEDIIEKQVISNTICVGVYSFRSSLEFLQTYEKLNRNPMEFKELYLSHLISYMIGEEKAVFELITANEYQDWGTVHEWIEEQKKYRTFFVDVDGILIKNCGRYGTLNWSNNSHVLKRNLDAIKKLQDAGAQIVITTSRPESNKPFLMELLEKHGIKPFACVMGLNHAPRIIINDFANSNPYPSCYGISVPRDSNLEEYLK